MDTELTEGMTRYFCYGQAKWDLKSCELQRAQDGTDMVKLCKGGLCLGFPRLVFSQLGCHRNNEWTLSSSVGYKELQDLRNEACAQEARQEFLKNLPKWQHATAKEKPKRASRAQMKDKRATVSTIKIDVPVPWGEPGEIQSLKIAKPILASDELTVELSKEIIDFAAKYMAAKGFSEDLKRSAYDVSLPKGVRKKRDSKSNEKLRVMLPESATALDPKRRKSVVVAGPEEAKEVLADPMKFLASAMDEEAEEEQAASEDDRNDDIDDDGMDDTADGEVADVDQGETDQLMAVASGSNEAHGDGELNAKPSFSNGQKDLRSFFGQQS